MAFPTLTDVDRRWVVDDIGGADSDPISSVPDSSGNSAPLTQADSSRQPTIAAGALNGHDVARFASDFLVDATYPNSWSDDSTRYIVFTPTLSGGPKTLIGGQRVSPYTPGLRIEGYGSQGKLSLQRTGASTVGTASTAMAAGSHVATLTLSATGDYEILLDGTSILTGNSGLSGSRDGVGVGAEYSSTSSSYDYLAGDVAEVIICNTVHDATTRAKVHSYVQDTYGITVSDYAAGGTDVDLTGVAATLVFTAPAGTLTASSTASNVDLTGQPAAYALAAPAGTLDAASATSDVTLTGVTADWTAGAPQGSVELTTSIDGSGATAAYTLAAPAGTLTLVSTADVALTGAAATYVLDAPAGTVAAESAATDVALTGAVADYTMVAPPGTVTASSSTDDVTLTGAAASYVLATPAGTVAANSVVTNVTLTGDAAVYVLTAPAGTYSSGSTATDIELTGQPAVYQLTAPAGSLEIRQDVALTGAPATWTTSTPAGTLTARSNVTISGQVSAYTLAAHAGTVALASLIDLVGATAAFTLSAPAGTVAVTRPPNYRNPRTILTLPTPRTELVMHTPQAEL